MSNDLHRISANFYGISIVPENLRKEYGYALLAIAGSDGDLSDPELEWLIVECAEAVGIDQEILADWEAFDYEMAELEGIFNELNSKTFGNLNKLLIYDAIRMASADGDYADDEKETVHESASILNVNPETVLAIEALVSLENATNSLRLTIL